MSIQTADLPHLVDVTNIAADTVSADVGFACSLAMTYDCASVIVNPYWLARATAGLRDRDDILRGTTSAFPFGGELTSVKIYSAEQCALHGAQELDMVMNVGAFLSGRPEDTKREIELVRENLEIPLKVIIEAPLLTDEQIAEAAELVVSAGADFVKTSTGLYGKVTPTQIRIIKETVGERAKVKAAGGIRTLDDMRALLDAGADRFGIGSRSAYAIFQEIDRELGRGTPAIQ